jgi:hypothetical protein
MITSKVSFESNGNETRISIWKDQKEKSLVFKTEQNENSIVLAVVYFSDISGVYEYPRCISVLLP